MYKRQSLLGDPRNMAAKDFLNKVKQRQWWRPVAPIILEESMNDWFENARPSPYMLMTFRIKQDKLNLMPAVSQLDNSARVQTVTKSENQNLFSLLCAFMDVTGVPLLCNTSLNDKGEPIINTPEQALNFALRKNIRRCYINNYRVVLKSNEIYPAHRPLEREYIKYTASDDTMAEDINRFNPYGVDEVVCRIAYNLHFLEDYDLTDKESAEKMKKRAGEVCLKYFHTEDMSVIKDILIKINLFD